MQTHDGSGLPTSCPTGDQLTALADGLLTGDAQTTVADHVSACPRCAAAYRGLDEVGSRLVTLLRDADETVDSEEPEAQCLRARAVALGGGLSQTPSPEGVL